jgi:methyl-accepting chemotaxis protein
MVKLIKPAKPTLETRNVSLVSFQNSEILQQKAFEERRSIVHGITLVIFAAQFFVLLVSVLLIFLGVSVFAFSIIGVIANLVLLSNLYLTRRVCSKSELEFATFLLPASMFLFVLLVNLIYQPGGSISAAFIMAAAFTGIVGLEVRKLTLLLILNGLGLVFTLINNYFLKFYPFDPLIASNRFIEVLLWLSIFMVTVGTVLVTAIRLNRSKLEVERHAAELSRVLSALDSSVKFSANVSADVSRVMATLEETSRTQSYQMQEQTSAFTEVATSLSELSNTASQIAALAEAATSFSSEMVKAAEHVMSTNDYSQDLATKGSQAVAETAASAHTGRNQMEVLGQRLLQLTEQMRRVSSVVELIDSIADETHLLALNAAIEAAGTGISSSDAGRRLQGERFGVIAQEIRNLAERSREATEEVRQFIGAMQASVAAAVLVAEESKKGVVATSARSTIAGAVIEQLIGLIKQNSHSASQILQAMQEIKVRCEEISIATLQQRTASYQISESVQGVSENSRAFAVQVNHLAVAVSQVSGRVDELTGTLTASVR